VRNFLLSSAHFFLENHVDGIRVDAVSALVSHRTSHHDWELNKLHSHWNMGGEHFLRSLNTMSHEKFRGSSPTPKNSRDKSLTHNDTSPATQWGYGFDGRWNFKFSHACLDILKADSNESSMGYIRKMIKSFEDQKRYQNVTTVSHDEVSSYSSKNSLYGRARGADHAQNGKTESKPWDKALLASGVLTFMGSEFGMENKWDYSKPFDRSEVENELNWGLLALTRDLNEFYKHNRAFWNAGERLERFSLYKA
jgi:1,4-alpha-glucan branching enzyme